MDKELNPNWILRVDKTHYYPTIDVKIHLLSDNAVLPSYAHEGDAGFDLSSTIDATIFPGETVLIPTGLAFEIPYGYELQIRPRSGISVKTNLRIANSPATIDSGYRGEVMVIVQNITSTISSDGTSVRNIKGESIGERGYWPTATSYVIHRGDRIAQGVISPVMRANFNVVSDLNITERGIDGFGSSGI